MPAFGCARSELRHGRPKRDAHIRRGDTICTCSLTIKAIPHCEEGTTAMAWAGYTPVPVKGSQGVAASSSRSNLNIVFQLLRQILSF